MKHEQETLTAVINARNEAESVAKLAAKNPGDGTLMKKLGGMESMLSDALGKFRAVSEAYPELKANEQVSELMEELGTTENRIAFARQAFNDAVMTYNTYREQFPNIIIAGPTGFHHAELLELQDQEARQAIKISMT
jgi:LemA protein